MIKWGIITFSAGIVLMIIEYFVAKRKKEGFVPSDRQRIMGIFWLTIFITALVVGLIWMT
ncbi:MAG: hypothetical protein FJY55_01510 [Betaproteobacteria bacterium]|nr:hypothetical protein [Betaproteobacteria bacterium]